MHLRVLAALAHYFLGNQEVHHAFDVVLGAHHEAVHVQRVAFLGVLQKEPQKVQPEEGQEGELLRILIWVGEDRGGVVDEDVTQVVNCDDRHMLEAVAGVGRVVAAVL